MKSDISRSEAVCVGALSRWKVLKLSKSDRFWVFFVVAMVKLQFVINKADEVYHRSSLTVQQVCQHQLRQAILFSRHMTSALHHD